MADTKRLQADALMMIKRWGALGFLVRNGVKRTAWMATANISPRDRGLFEDGSVNFNIDGSIPTPPDFELDVIQFKGAGKTLKQYRILQPPSGPNSNGIQVVWQVNAMYQKDV